MSIILYYMNLNKKTDNIVCDVFRAAAIDTWNRIKFSRTTPGLKINETTITQNLVYELNLLKTHLPIANFSIFESTNEQANGDDLLIELQNVKGEIIRFAIQAKIIYHSGNYSRLGSNPFEDGFYPRMKHLSGKTPQIKLLLDYAKKNNAIPLYLLYNYIDYNYTNEIDLYCKNIDLIDYGCSIVSAQYLKKLYFIKGNLTHKVKFSHLYLNKNTLFPWMIMPCNFMKESSANIFSMFNNNQLINSLYEGDGIDTDFYSEQWKPIGVKRDVAIENTNEDFNRYFLSNKLSNLFMPKYKIFIGAETINQE